MLGQLQNKAASAALSDVLRNVNEHPMVRHEAAEALGSIAGITSSSCYSMHSLFNSFGQVPETLSNFIIP